MALQLPPLPPPSPTAAVLCLCGPRRACIAIQIRAIPPLAGVPRAPASSLPSDEHELDPLLPCIEGTRRVDCAWAGLASPRLLQPSITDLRRSPAGSGNVAIVRIRSTTSVCLLHGLVLLPCGISVAGADHTSAGDTTELKWEFGEDLGRYYVSFPDDQ